MKVDHEPGAFWAESYARQVGTVATALDLARASTRPRRSRAVPPTVAGTGAADIVRAAHAAAVEVTRMRKLTPLEPYVPHRSYPSPRSVFATEFGSVAPGPQSSAEARFFVDLSRIPAAYGRLRRALALLEAGHLWSSLDAALAPHRLRTIGAPAVHWQGAAHAELTFRVGYVTQPLDLFGTDTARCFDRRTSNPPAPAWYDDSVPEGVAEGVLLGCRAEVMAVTAGLQVSFVLHRREAATIAALRLHSDGSTSVGEHPFAPTAAQPDATLPRTAITFCMPTGQARRVGAADETLLRLGWAAQTIALLAGLHELAARPLRSIDEAAICSALRLPLDEVPVYQLRLAPAWRTAFTVDLG